MLTCRSSTMTLKGREEKQNPAEPKWTGALGWHLLLLFFFFFLI
jgi:hypothetical protein